MCNLYVFVSAANTLFQGILEKYIMALLWCTIQKHKLDSDAGSSVRGLHVLLVSAGALFKLSSFLPQN